MSKFNQLIGVAINNVGTLYWVQFLCCILDCVFIPPYLDRILTVSWYLHRILLTLSCSPYLAHRILLTVSWYLHRILTVSWTVYLYHVRKLADSLKVPYMC